MYSAVKSSEGGDDNVAYTLNQRREHALAEVDNATFSLAFYL